jgi:hypothetical protein
MVMIEDGFDPSGAVTLPQAAEAEVRATVLELGKKRAFGSVKVAVSLGASRWQTTLCPIKGGGLFLPIKKPVRIAEGLSEGDVVEVELAVL